MVNETNEDPRRWILHITKSVGLLSYISFSEFSEVVKRHEYAGIVSWIIVQEGLGLSNFTRSLIPRVAILTYSDTYKFPGSKVESYDRGIDHCFLSFVSFKQRQRDIRNIRINW